MRSKPRSIPSLPARDESCAARRPNIGFPAAGFGRLGSLLTLMAMLFGQPAAIRAFPLASTSDDPVEISQRAVRLLAIECIACHGPDSQEGELRLDSAEWLASGGESGAILDSGEPNRSRLLAAVRGVDGVALMPPKKPLGDSSIRLLERWIEGGAAWPEQLPIAPIEPQADEVDSAVPDASEIGDVIGDAWTDDRNPVARIFGRERLDLWSLQAPLDLPTPGVITTAQVRQPIDAFVVEELSRSGIPAGPAADRRTLLRRLTLDLTGLPPSVDQIEQFEADTRPDSYERQVDRLLASVRQGEHAARAWLDVVRYSDSNGFDWDEFRPQAWRYRDYVVEAFNRDLPYARFVTEQLAGDETVGDRPADEEQLRAWIATGFLRLGPHDNAAKLFDEQDRSRAELMEDLVETTAAAFLGQTYSCCRCHDHKTEPLLQADHYRLRAFFAGVEFADDRPLETAPQQQTRELEEARIDAALAQVDERRRELLEPALEAWQAARAARAAASAAASSEETQATRSTAPDESAEEQSDDEETPSDKELLKLADESTRRTVERLDEERGQVESRRPKPAYGLLMTEQREPIGPTFVLYQGDHKSPREEVAAGFPSLWNPAAAAISSPAAGESSGRRSALAAWIVAPENPWTYRVAANRVWQGLFGQGLVATPNDFGLSGDAPSHPQLLDRLASDLIRSDGSLKSLRRRIVVSGTYRQVGIVAGSAAERLRQQRAWEIDPEVRLLWRFPTKRLTAEQLRDSILQVADALDSRCGGPPIWPELPADILQANPAFLDDNETRTKGWYPSPVADRRVRSLYWVQKRTVRIPFQETFDLPENSVSCAARGTSIVPPQALTLLNGDLMEEASGILARTVESEVAAAEPQRTARLIISLYRRTLQRPPSDEEAAACFDYLQRRSLQELARVLLNVAEFATIE